MLFDLKHRRVDEISMEKQFTSSEPFFLYFVFSWTKSHYYKYIVLHLQLKGVSEGYKGFPGEHLEV